MALRRHLCGKGLKVLIPQFRNTLLQVYIFQIIILRNKINLFVFKDLIFDTSGLKFLFTTLEKYFTAEKNGLFQKLGCLQ